MSRLFDVFTIDMNVLFTCLVCFNDFIISHNLTMLLLFQDLRIATTVAVVIGFFVICWTPFFGINFAFAVCIATLFKRAGCPGLMTLPTWILSVNKWLQYGNSVCNPVIYGFRNKDFRRAFEKILLGLCCKKVRQSDYSKSACGRTVRSAYLQRESSFENSRSVTFPLNVPLGMFDMRDSYRRAIQSGHSKPIKLKLTQKKSVANGLLSINVDAFRSSNEFSSSTSVWNLSSEASVSPAQLCNPAFEEDDQIDICPVDQAIPGRDSNDNISSESTNSMYNSSSKGSVHSEQAYVRFSDSKTKEKDSEHKTVANLGFALDRKRSLSEIFLRTTSAKENCGGHFLRNTSWIVKKKLTLIMLVCNHGDYPFEEFCIFYANEKQKQKKD